MKIGDSGTYDGCKKPHIRLGKYVAHEVVLAVQYLLKAVKRSKQLCDCVVVRLLRLGKAGSVYAVYLESMFDSNHRAEAVKNLLFTVSYTHSLRLSISALRESGYRSIAALLAGSSSLKAVLNIRMISELSLLTAVFNVLSHSKGTVYLQVDEHDLKNVVE